MAGSVPTRGSSHATNGKAVAADKPRGGSRKQCNSTVRLLAKAAAPAALCSGGQLLPALFVIGSLKTGTTSLWSQLVDNSDGHVLSGALTDKGDVSQAAPSTRIARALPPVGFFQVAETDRHLGGDRQRLLGSCRSPPR